MMTSSAYAHEHLAAADARCVARAGGVRFHVWAPDATALHVVCEPPRLPPVALEKFSDGSFGALVPGAGVGDRYRYRIDTHTVLPDPASRFQPEGVHGPSEVVDPSRFIWSDRDWTGPARNDLVLYELHVGTFTPEGTFAAAAKRLLYLAQLGVTAVELMPLADFPVRRNWGYDGVDLFAPARCHGMPDDLRRLVDTAHGLGLAVLLDVVYNHLGPEGNYLSAFSPYYFSDRHETPWGKALNFDGPHSSKVRQFFIENALHWVHEYHIDGLRLDATHAIVDHDSRTFVAQLAGRVRESTPRLVYVIAEDHRNLASMIRPEGEMLKVLPDAVIDWRDVWVGAAITAALFVAGRYLIALYLTYAAPASTYGAAGSLVLILLWVYYSSLILFFGAALTKAQVLASGRRVIPRQTAVRIREDIVEE